MRFWYSLVAAAALAGCASSGGVQQAGTIPTTMETINVRGAVGGSMSMAMVHEANANGAAVSYGAQETFIALRAVYDSLGIPVTTLDQTNRVIGNAAFKIRRQLARVPLSKYLNCGTTQGGPSADSYELIVSISTQARPQGQRTLVMTTLDGQGRPVAMSGDYVHCATTAALEAHIVEMTNAILRR
jgi:hypothetical protein